MLIKFEAICSSLKLNMLLSISVKLLSNERRETIMALGITVIPIPIITCSRALDPFERLAKLALYISPRDSMGSTKSARMKSKISISPMPFFASHRLLVAVYTKKIYETIQYARERKQSASFCENSIEKASVTVLIPITHERNESFFF